ncbi:MAG: AHH domain-containing protein [Halanaerobiales bacterium]
MKFTSVPVAFLLISQPLNEGAELYPGLTNEQIIQLQDQERNSTSTPPMEPVPDWLKNPGIRDFPIDAQRSLDILDFPLGDVPDTSTPPMIPDRLTSPNIWDMPYDDARSIDDLVMMMSGYKPLQRHHFLTNKSRRYTPVFENIISNYNLKLDDVWNTELLPHQGRHPYAYHDYMLKTLREINDIAKGDKDLFMDLFEQLKQEVIDDPDMLDKEYWGK